MNRQEQHALKEAPIAEITDPWLRYEWRRRAADWLNRWIECIPFEKRRWFRITEIADEYARKSGSLIVDQEKRQKFLSRLCASIVAGEFVDSKGRSRVLNLHPSERAEFRLDPLMARNPEQFLVATGRVEHPVAYHVFLRTDDWFAWFERHEINLPRMLRLAKLEADKDGIQQPREQSSTAKGTRTKRPIVEDAIDILGIDLTPTMNLSDAATKIIANAKKLGPERSTKLLDTYRDKHGNLAKAIGRIRDERAKREVN